MYEHVAADADLNLAIEEDKIMAQKVLNNAAQGLPPIVDFSKSITADVCCQSLVSTDFLKFSSNLSSLHGTKTEDQ